MAIAEEAPESVLRTFLQDAFSAFSLPLTQRNADRFDFHLFSKSLQVFSRIDTRCHNENYRRHGCTLFINLLHRRRFRRGELGRLEVVVHEVDHGEADAIRAEAPEHDHLLHGVFALGLPLAGKLELLGLGLHRGEPSVPVLRV